MEQKMMLGGMPVVSRYQNGRVVAMDIVPASDYKNFKGDNNDNDHFKCTAVKRIQTDSALGHLYFSKRNMDNLQAKIRKTVYDRSHGKYLVGESSTTELEIIMRAIFLQYAQFRPESLVKQVHELNAIVIEQTVPEIMSNVAQYMGYLHDVQHLPIPIPLPKNLSSKGTKLLNSVTSTF